MDEQNQTISSLDSGEMTLGDALALPIEESSDTGEMTLEQAMGLSATPEQFITPIEEKDKQTFMKWTSNAIMSGIYAGSSSFNDMLGLVGQFSPPGMLIKSFPEVEKALRKTFVTSGREEAERLRNESYSGNKAVQFAFDTLSGFANMGVTLPIDLMTGGLAKSLVGTRIAPEIAKLLSAIPDFALGTGFRGFTEGVQKEGNVVEKTLSGLLGGAEAVAINTAFGKNAEGIKGFVSLPAIGMAEKYYQALKEGRIATADEVIQGAATGLVYQSISSALPHVKKASVVGSEKLALGYYERKLDKALNSGNIEKAQKVMAEFMADERVRPEVREPIARLLEYKPKEALEYKPKEVIEYKPTKEGQVEVAKPSPEYLDTINTRLRDLYTMLPSIKKRGDPNMTAAIEREIKDLSATQMELMNQSRQEGFALQEKNRIKTATEIALEKTKGIDYIPKDESKTVTKPVTPIKNTIKIPAKESISEGKLKEASEDKGEVIPVKENIPGETKVSGLSSRLEAELVKEGIISDMEGKAEYSTINHADQAKRSIELVNTNWELAKQIAKGEAQAPDGLKNISVYNAVKTRSIMENDVSTLRDLGMSKVATEVSQSAQTLGLVQRRDPLDPVRAINEIYETSKETVKRIFKVKSVEKLVKDHVDQIKSEIRRKAPSKEDWASFIRSIQC